MKKRIMALTLATLMLIPNIPAYAVGGVIGESGSIENNGEVGKNGGVNPYPSFRVGLINEEFNAPLNLNKKPDKIRRAIINNFNNHYPKIKTEVAVIFSPPEVFKTGDEASYGEYNCSTGNLDYTSFEEIRENKGIDLAYHHRVIGTTKIEEDTNLYYQALYNYVEANDKDDKCLSDCKWKDFLPAEHCTNAELIWNYLLANWENESEPKSTEERLKIYTHI